MVHVSQCRTAKSMWDSLEAVHESKGHQTIVSIIQNLFHTKAEEESNISEHLNQLQRFVKRLALDQNRTSKTCHNCNPILGFTACSFDD